MILCPQALFLIDYRSSEACGNERHMNLTSGAVAAVNTPEPSVRGLVSHCEQFGSNKMRTGDCWVDSLLENVM